MSDLRPAGILLRIGGQEYSLLFTIRAIDEIQSSCNLPLPGAIGYIARAANGGMEHDTLVVFRSVLAALLNESAGGGLTDTDAGNLVTRGMYRAVAWAILAAYEDAMPEPEEDEDDEDEEEKKQEGGDRAVNIARMLYIGCKILNYTEEEVFQMTLRKFYLIYNEHLELNGIRKKEDESLLDAF